MEHAVLEIYSHVRQTGTVITIGAGFKCVEALSRIIIRGAPYPPSNAIIYMHLQL